MLPFNFTVLNLRSTIFGIEIPKIADRKLNGMYILIRWLIILCVGRSLRDK